MQLPGETFAREWGGDSALPFRGEILKKKKDLLLPDRVPMTNQNNNATLANKNLCLLGSLIERERL